MRLLIIFSFCVIGLSAQSYLVQNFFSELINNCNARTNSFHYPLINLIRDRFWNTANEFPKFSTSFYQVRLQLGDRASKIFTRLDSTINSCYSTLANDMNDYYIRQDFKSILDTMTEGFVNVLQNAINDFKKVIDKNIKKMSCFDQEKEAIRLVVDGFFNKTNDDVRNQIAELDEEILDTQTDLIIFRITLESEVKSCGKNLNCTSNYFNDNVGNIIVALKASLTEAYAEASQGWQNIENEVIENIQKYDTDFEAIRVRINDCFKKA